MSSNFDSVFYIAISTLCVGVISLSIKTCLKSRCSEVDICGILHIKRDVKIEEDIEVERIKRGLDSENSSPVLDFKHEHKV